MASTSIRSVRARRVWDSRGRPTLEAEVALGSGAVGRAIAPAGASRGSREAIDLRDGGVRFGGLDVMRAIVNVNGPIAARLLGRDATDQTGVDATLCACDGTSDKSNLGANATVAVSMAVAHAAAAAKGIALWRHLADGAAVTMPLPEVQIIGGGAHASRRIDLQDLMIMPIGAWTFGDAITMCAEVYRSA
ncbi:MAG TPA: phosphopyruvate hydratase, partial [Casimicrobiaceae bacterium]|nr:phosphopyruvate hydratase [Casimicrobiaceae bacterium]